MTKTQGEKCHTIVQFVVGAGEIIKGKSITGGVIGLALVGDCGDEFVMDDSWIEQPISQNEK
jgi:hypothetical protein